MRWIIIIIVLLGFQKTHGQELFVVTDPASNVPANSLAVNIMQSSFKEKFEKGYNYHLMPEVTYGLSKNLMFRGSAFISNRNNQLYAEGGSLMAKYRFYSMDDLNSHFRLAAYGRYSFNRADIHQEQVEILGHNTGFETGIIATKLVKKLAISTSVSYEKAFDNKPQYDFPNNFGDNATNYTLSFGRLMYPKKYISFKQTNINLMVEFVGQTINENGRTFVDIVPAIQFIFNSQARIDLAYRQELYSSMLRTAPNGIYFNLYYTFFNLKKKLMENKKYIPALGYDFLTAYYDLAIKITMPEKKFRRLLVEEINSKENEHILEFGFGKGQNLLLVHKENPKAKLEGLDIDPKVKAIAEHKLAKNNIEIPLHLYDGGILPFTDNTFDKVYSCLVFHQLDAETKLNCLKELHRVLKPNGKLIIADWGKAQNKLMRFTFRLVQLLDGFKTTNDNVKGLMPDFITKAGFDNVLVTKSINTAIGTFSYFNATKNEIS